MEELNEITYKIRGAIFEVFNELGPGLLESVYESALLVELNSIGLNARSQVRITRCLQKYSIGFRF